MVVFIVDTGAIYNGQRIGRRSKLERCPWCLGNEKMIRYNDEQWGMTAYDDGDS